MEEFLLEILAVMLDETSVSRTIQAVKNHSNKENTSKLRIYIGITNPPTVSFQVRSNLPTPPQSKPDMLLISKEDSSPRKTTWVERFKAYNEAFMEPNLP